MSKVLTDKQFELVKMIVDDYLTMNTDMETRPEDEKQFSEVLQLSVDLSAGMQQQSEPKSTFDEKKYMKFLDALKNFAQAANVVRDNFYPEDYSSKEYPFSKSFDEVTVDIWNWCETEHDDYKDNLDKYIAELYKGQYRFLVGWRDINTGGHCMVFYKEFTDIKGNKILIGLNDEGIGLYNISMEKYDCDDIDIGEYFETNYDFESYFNACSATAQDIHYVFSNNLTLDQCADIIHAVRVYIGKYRG